MQETFARLGACEASTAQTQALVVQLAAREQALRADLERMRADLAAVTDERDVLKLLMTVSMGPIPEKKTVPFEEYQP